MNINRFYLQALGVSGLFIGLLLTLWTASGGPASEAEVRNANNTRTAIALTEVFLLGPFPTSTAPTSTAWLTPTRTVSPTNTLPHTSTPTPTHIIIYPTATQTKGSGPMSTQPPLPAPTYTSIPPTQTPIPQPTNPPPTNPPPTDPPPTDPPPTDPPVEPPPPTTDTDPPFPQLPCLNPVGIPIPCH